MDIDAALRTSSLVTTEGALLAMKSRIVGGGANSAFGMEPFNLDGAVVRVATPWAHPGYGKVVLCSGVFGLDGTEFQVLLKELEPAASDADLGIARDSERARAATVLITAAALRAEQLARTKSLVTTEGALLAMKSKIVGGVRWGNSAFGMEPFNLDGAVVRVATPWAPWTRHNAGRVVLCSGVLGLDGIEFQVLLTELEPAASDADLGIAQAGASDSISRIQKEHTQRAEEKATALRAQTEALNRVRLLQAVPSIASWPQGLPPADNKLEYELDNYSAVFGGTSAPGVDMCTTMLEDADGGTLGCAELEQPLAEFCRLFLDKIIENPRRPGSIGESGHLVIARNSSTEVSHFFT